MIMLLYSLGNIQSLTELSNNNQGSQQSFGIFLLYQIIALVLSLILSYIYKVKGRSISNRKEFSSNFPLLTVTTMLIIAIVKSSLALSLGLVGALSIVRFRTAIKEPEELTYIFLCIAIGLGLGANQLGVTMLGFIVSTVYLVTRDSFTNQINNKYLNLIITYPNDKNIELEEIVNIIKRCSKAINLTRLSDDKEFCESSFTLEVDNFQDLLKLRKEISSRYEDISISFLDNSFNQINA